MGRYDNFNSRPTGAYIMHFKRIVSASCMDCDEDSHSKAY